MGLVVQLEVKVPYLYDLYSVTIYQLDNRPSYPNTEPGESGHKSSRRLLPQLLKLWGADERLDPLGL